LRKKEKLRQKRGLILRQGGKQKWQKEAWVIADRNRSESRKNIYLKE
jgi:hypothetical protein